MIVGRDSEVEQAAAALAEPGLVVIAGGPGIGRTTVAYAAAARVGLPVHAGAGLVMLRHVPYLPLSRAIAAPLPPADRALAVEAVRARVGRGLLLLDDLQWADQATLDLIPELARYLPVLAAVRVPAPLAAAEQLLQVSRCWVALGPLDDAAAGALLGAVAPGLTPAGLIAAAQGNPAVLTTLARSGPGQPPASIAALVAELPQDERTALAALGLLGRPAPRRLLGSGAAALAERGLITGERTVAARERIVAEVAAGVLPAEQRAAMHRRLADLVPDDGEAARHLAAAGEPAAAAERAAGAAAAATSPDARADYLALAAEQEPTPTRLLDAARAALAAGRTGTAAQLAPATPEAAVLQARIALQQADPVAARALLDAVAGQLAGDPGYTVACVLAETELDPDAACVLAEADPAPTPELLIAYGQALLRAGRPGWETPLRRAGESADRATALLAGAALVAGLRDRLRTAEAGALAAELARRCAEDAAYSWELNFTAELLWSRLHGEGATDDVVTAGTRLTERSLPAPAARLLAATVGLARGDGGALATGLVASDRLTTWVAGELAWLDGDPAGARTLLAPLLDGRTDGRSDIAATLAAVTTTWCGGKVDPAGLPEPAATALKAIQDGDPEAAAAAWDGVMLRERVRALLGADAQGPLLQAETLADQAGLTVLLGRIRRALRRHGVARRPAHVRGALSAREHEVMALVAGGQSSRRIADRLGLTTNTVETYVRSAMTKLGAKTRTEAAVRAGELR